MGYQVYWENGRWQGYGVPAYCDYPGCQEEIDRGMGYWHPKDEENGSGTPAIFCCETHKNTDIDLATFEVEPKEHPDWIRHVRDHESWAGWREKEPEAFARLLAMMPEEESIAIARELKGENG